MVMDGLDKAPLLFKYDIKTDCDNKFKVQQQNNNIKYIYT